MNGYWYLASPYTDYPGGIDAASHEACANAGLLLDAGILVFSPIAHFHAIRCVIGEHPHDFWMAADKPFMDAARGLIILELPGWETSRGVAMEIAFFWRLGRQIVHMKPEIVPALLDEPPARAVR